MDFLFSIPYLVRILLSLFAILFFQKVTRRLDAAMVLGMAMLAAWTGQSARSALAIAGDRLFSFDMLFLAFVIAGVIWLSSLMAETGIMKDLVASLRTRLSRRALLAALPAVVGLLPMPAGALFSCPLLDDADADGRLGNYQKTTINYWFRHGWEFWWPLYPGVLLALDMSGLAIWKFVLLMCPLFLAAAFSGYVFLLRGTPGGGPAPRGEGDRPFLPLVLPILTVVGVYAILFLVAPSTSRFNKYLPMAIGIVCGLAVMQLLRPASMAAWRKTLFSRRWLSLVLVIILARLYGAFIEARLGDGVPLMEHVRGELDTFGIPAVLLIVLIPFVSGLTTGITVGYIGASFPVVLSLAGPGPEGLYAAIVLGYASGFAGMMLSPIHVCLIVTNDYFKTSMTGSIRTLLKPSLLLFAFAVLYSFFWRSLA